MTWRSFINPPRSPYATSLGASRRRNYVPNITNAEAIAAFTKGLQHEQLCGKLYRKRSTTIDELIQTANEYTDTEEAKRATHSTHHQRRNK